MALVARTLVLAFIGGILCAAAAAVATAPSPTWRCEPYPGKRVVLMTVTADFLDFFDNWHLFADPYLTDSEHLIVIAQDKTVFGHLQARAGNATKPFEVVLSPAATAKPLLSLFRMTYKSLEYGKLMAQVPNLILPYLRQGCPVLYSDVDMVWTADPFADMEATGDHEMYVIDDKLEDKPEKKWKACGCFLYMKPTAKVVSAMNNWSKRIVGQQRNQPELNKVLRRNQNLDANDKERLDLKVLPRAKYPPGVAASRHRNATVYHANWRIGRADKVSFFRSMGRWKVAELGAQ